MHIIFLCFKLFMLFWAHFAQLINNLFKTYKKSIKFLNANACEIPSEKVDQ